MNARKKYERFVLPAKVIEYLHRCQDDATLGTLLVRLFRHKVDGEVLDWYLGDDIQVCHLIDRISEELCRVQAETERRMKNRRLSIAEPPQDRPGIVPGRSRDENNREKRERKEKEISPHTPYIEKEIKAKRENLSRSSLDICSPAGERESEDVGSFDFGDSARACDKFFRRLENPVLRRFCQALKHEMIHDPKCNEFNIAKKVANRLKIGLRQYRKLRYECLYKV